MKCVIPGGNVKIVAKAIHAISKIGDEMYVLARSNNLSFRTTNMASSAYADFTFSENYFSYYDVDDIEENKDLKCKISMRSAMTVFKTPNAIDKQVETCHIEFSANADFLFITLNYKNSIIKRHILPILDSVRLQAEYVIDGATNQLSAQSTVFVDAIQNFQQNLVEITLEILEQKVLLRNYANDRSSITNITRTQLVLFRGEFDKYSVNTENVITFCLKELKAILNFAELVKLPINIYIETAGRPAVFVVKNSTFEAILVLSTLNPDVNSQNETTITIKAIKPVRKKRTVKRSTKRSNKSSSRKNNASISNRTITYALSPEKETSCIEIGREAKDNDIHVLPKEYNQNDIPTNVSVSTTGNMFSNPSVSSDNKKSVCSVFSNELKRKSSESDTIEVLKKENIVKKNDDDDFENIVHKTSSSPPSKKARFIFKKCFQTTFDLSMLPGHDIILVEDSDENNE